MSDINRMPLLLNLSRRYVLFMFRRYYGEFIVTGQENIPKKYPVIFAPNHVNALMDALAVHYIVPRNQVLVFLARADIFKNRKVAQFLNFAKILPAFRMRDGIENLGNNSKIFDECIEILHNNNSLGIMPEGNQEIERKLRPLVKGIFRIAFAAQQKYAEIPGVKIVPIGIDYGDIIKSQKHIIINIGKPIEVSEYMKLFAENPAKAMNEIRDKLSEDLSALTLNLATTNKYYGCFETNVDILQELALENYNLSDNTFNRYVARQKIAERLVLIEKNNPDQMVRLSELTVQLSDLLERLKMKCSIFSYKELKWLALIFEIGFCVLTFPVFLTGFLMNVIPFFSPVFIRKYILKAEFIGFYSSLHYVLGIITFPLFYIIQTLLFSFFVSSSWWIVLLFFLIQYPIGKMALSWYRKTIKLGAKIRFKQIEKLQSVQLIEAHNKFNDIVNLVLK